MQTISTGARQMVKTYALKFVTHPLGRLLVVAGFIALGAVIAIFALRTLHQSGPGDLWGNSVQDDPLQSEAQTAAPQNNTLGHSARPGREAAGSQGTDLGSSQGSSQGGDHGSGK
jgi:hypothetical protein